jgi:hypothetical protein
VTKGFDRDDFHISDSETEEVEKPKLFFKAVLKVDILRLDFCVLTS